MAGKFLLAQTPRAGADRAVKTNHRLLTSPNSSLNEAGAADLLREACEKLGESPDDFCVGDDYIAVVQRGVFQVHDGRRGDEVLILSGIGTEHIESPAQQDLVARLQARLPVLKEVVDSVD